jgi:hypothetical protein
METIMHISVTEKIHLGRDDYKYILENCDSKINNAIWLLEMKKFGVPNNHSWTIIIEEMIDLIVFKNELTSKYLHEFIKKTRELFYILFITNIDVKKVLLSLMKRLTERIDDIKLKYQIVEIVSSFELRISQGTRYIVHLEAMMIQILTLLNDNKNVYHKPKQIEYII